MIYAANHQPVAINGKGLLGIKLLYQNVQGFSDRSLKYVLKTQI